MINLIDKLYAKIPVRGLILRSIRYVLRVIANINTRYFTKTKCINGLINDDTLIVSLTSYPARINTIWMVIKTLLNQKNISNFVVILWLSKEQFPKEIESLPKNLKCLSKKGLDIRFVDDDLKSHKKYFYSFKEYPNNVVITVDDDVLYPSDLIEVLFKAHEKYPDCVICNRGAVISENMPYRKWKQVDNYMIPQNDILPTGIGGVLYPPKSYDKAIFNIDAIKQTCINGDDLWLSLMCRLNGTKIVFTGIKYGFVTVLSTQKTALCIENVNDNKNDSQIFSLTKWMLKNYGKNFYL